MWNVWNEAFRGELSCAERSYVSELRDARNQCAHQHKISIDDACRFVDTAHRLLSAISASEANTVQTMKNELFRRRVDEQQESWQGPRSVRIPIPRDPWEEVTERLKVGDAVEGKMTSIKGFCAFVEIEEALQAAARIEDECHRHIGIPPKSLNRTDGRDVYSHILQLDQKRKKISLGMW